MQVETLVDPAGAKLWRIQTPKSLSRATDTTGGKMWSLSENAGPMFLLVSACFTIACFVEVHTRLKENERAKAKHVKNASVELSIRSPLILALVSGLIFLITLVKVSIK
jgi:hypothetical protein